ncbi:E2F-associated phospho protein-domain-containing protein [Jimgerdemannia flammicorona]|uniref:E2F-associated phospho protein-domain-containing protein n=2 Tax=Jimgerdemannia flammicorona TaxID=994334 RepID=A0A433QAS6_9FUNG|nr:E2F-associated phospho protein-domain-containing protein [Jimgerdemannia flammicorona]RUS26908.1 E2F-associated phospho protein-domain-containing protein [Jimgerdemannia flammicorona]
MQSTEPQPQEAVKEALYDDVYFDTDSDDNETGGIKADKRVPTNDELLYDPGLDDADEKWLARQINKTMPKTVRTAKDPPVARTDAILTCPMCFTPVCYNCQRHDLYPNQYRAIFITNCHPNRTQRFRYAPSKGGSRKKTPKKGWKSRGATGEEDGEGQPGEPMDMENSEVYYPVECDICATQVAMMDEEEVFHFFNIIAT